MASRVEEMIVWQLCDALRKEVLRLADREVVRRDRRFEQDFTHAAASAQRNVEEGFARYEPAEFRRFLRIARGSLGEVRGHAADGIDRRFWSAADAEPAIELARRASIAAVRLMRYLESARAPMGTKRPRV